MILNNTVAIIEAGIGAMSLGFVEAGFQIKEIFVKRQESDRNSQEEYWRKNMRKRFDGTYAGRNFRCRCNSN